MINNVDLTNLNFEDIRNTFAQHVNGIGSDQDDNQMEEAESSEISFGADANTVGGIPLDQYCRGFESESESDELVFAESDSDDEEIKVDDTKINLVEQWAQNVDVEKRGEGSVKITVILDRQMSDNASSSTIQDSHCYLPSKSR